MPVDVVGELYDGTKMDGPAGLRDALLQHQDVFLRSFTENLLTYALGRRVEYYRHADGSRDRPRRGEERQQAVGVRPGHRQQPGVPDGEPERAEDGRRRLQTRER